MNPSEQKKWFVYVNDHHDGPYSVEQLREQKERGLLKPETYVWSEGMGDWDSLSQFPELMDAMEFRSNKRLEPTGLIERKPSQTPDEVNPPAAQAPAPAKNKFPVATVLTAFGTVFGVVAAALIALVALSQVAPESVHSKLRPMFAMVVSKTPFLKPFIQVIPKLDDITPEDKKALEAALLADPLQEIKIAFALSRADLSKPSFYVTSNLPSGTKLEIAIIGDGDTLLNELNFSAKNSVSTVSGFAKSESFTGPGGALVPKGEYKIVVYESATQSDSVRDEIAKYPSTQAAEKNDAVPGSARFVFGGKEFLGGEKDQTYLTRLRAFQDKVKDAAAKESSELTQYYETMKGAFEDMREKFKPIVNAKKVGPAQKKNWDAAFTSNTKVLEQITQTSQAWSEDMMNNEFFYGLVYKQVKTSLDILKKYSELVNNYSKNPTDKESFLIQVGQSITEVEQSLVAIKSKLDQIATNPKTPAGLPTRLQP